MAIVQQPCDGSDAQSWVPQQHGSGNDYYFLNQHSGACMYLDVNSPFNGAPIIQAPCNGVTNELWRTAPLPQVTVVTTRVGGRVTTFCIDVPGGSSANGLPVQLFSCNGSLAQRWVIGF